MTLEQKEASTRTLISLLDSWMAAKGGSGLRDTGGGGAKGKQHGGT
jgi:hypothetical protein